MAFQYILNLKQTCLKRNNICICARNPFSLFNLTRSLQRRIDAKDIAYSIVYLIWPDFHCDARITITEFCKQNSKNIKQEQDVNLEKIICFSAAIQIKKWSNSLVGDPL